MADNGDTTLNKEPIYTATHSPVVSVPITQDTTQTAVEVKPHHLAGNTYAMKYPTPEQRQAVFKKYCEHLRTGKPKNYFPDCDYDTISRYMKDFPEDFPTEQATQAEREGQNYLLSIGYMGMTGKIDGFKEKTWQFIIQNMTHWKLRTDVTSDDKKMDNVVIYRPTKVEEGSEE